jgi:hypothetical protein
MAQVVNAHLWQSCPLADAPPRVLKIGGKAAFQFPSNNIRVFRVAGQGVQHIPRSLWQGDAPRPGLGVGQFHMA